jgi:metal-responsive CopG/Arc/MetJ family transcriptional regulator
VHRHGVAWCKTTLQSEQMSDKRLAKEKAKTRHQPRASITFPPKLYRTLETLAKEKKVSIAWIVREAAEKYIGDELARPGKDKGYRA